MSSLDSGLNNLSADLAREIICYISQLEVANLFATLDRRLQRLLTSPGVFPSLFIELPMPINEIMLARSCTSAFRVKWKCFKPFEVTKNPFHPLQDFFSKFDRLTSFELEAKTADGPLTFTCQNPTLLTPADEAAMQRGTLFPRSQLTSLTLNITSFHDPKKSSPTQVGSFFLLLPKSLTKLELRSTDSNLGITSANIGFLPKSITHLVLRGQNQSLERGGYAYRTHWFSVLKHFENLRVVDLSTLAVFSDKFVPSDQNGSKVNSSEASTFAENEGNVPMHQRMSSSCPFPNTLESLCLNGISNEFLPIPAFPESLTAFTITSSCKIRLATIPAKKGKTKGYQGGLDEQSPWISMIKALPLQLHTLKILVPEPLATRSDRYPPEILGESLPASLVYLSLSLSWAADPLMKIIGESMVLLERLEFVNDYSKEMTPQTLAYPLPPRLNFLKMESLTIHKQADLTLLSNTLTYLHIERISDIAVLRSKIPNCLVEANSPLPVNLSSGLLASPSDSHLDALSLSNLLALEYQNICGLFTIPDMTLMPHVYANLESVDLKTHCKCIRSEYEWGLRYVERKLQKPALEHLRFTPLICSNFRLMPRLRTLKIGIPLTSMNILDYLPSTLTDLELDYEDYDLIGPPCFPPGLTRLSLATRRLVAHTIGIPQILQELYLLNSSLKPSEVTAYLPRTLRRLRFSTAKDWPWNSEQVLNLLFRLPDLSYFGFDRVIISEEHWNKMSDEARKNEVIIQEEMTGLLRNDTGRIITFDGTFYHQSL